MASSHHSARCLIWCNYRSCQPCSSLQGLLCRPHISSHRWASPGCSVGMSPTNAWLAVIVSRPSLSRITIISSSFPTRMPFLLTTCRYFNPLSTSCCTWKLAFMQNWAPSLIVKGFVFRASREPGAVRSMVISGRPSTPRARERMMQRRLSEGSTGRAGELEMPREAFQRLRDSSFWSIRDVRHN